ncbi:PREDICTED: protein HOTHEAD [Theobroma cacao]|uniref:Protein HOTHEAD n=1 Tax=Theobroma cacao TaxID=3641 RepID=A0AB32WE42_THECC|nr:PREDICTED: protein HOTHEAD [Theobroma cacao]
MQSTPYYKRACSFLYLDGFVVPRALCSTSYRKNMGFKYSWSSWRFLALVFAVEFAFHGFSYGEEAPKFGFIQDATFAPAVSYYDYIIIGGGTAGCPLAATLSQNANVLVLERGGSQYVNITKIRIENFLSTLTDNSPDSFSEAFISKDGVPNNRARVLGGGTVINGGFYSRAETCFLKQNGMDEALANDSYEWVEKKLVHKPVVLQWQSAVRDGLLEAGVLPYNGFTYDHINGTKTGGSILDGNGNRHTAADLLEYADPKRIKVYLHAVVHKIMFTTKVGSRPKAQGVIFHDAKGVRHTAFLQNGSRSEIISSAGAIGSPQLLMLSGIGPAPQLEALGIKVVLNQTLVGQGMADNPLNGLIIPSPVPVELSFPEIVGITELSNYIESTSGFDFSALSVAQSPANFNQVEKSPMASQEAMDNSPTNLGFIMEKFNGPISEGYLELQSTNVSDNPKVRFNYFQAPEDLRKCVQGVKTIINVVNSKSYSRFRYSNTTTQDLLNMMASMPVNLRPRHPNSTVSLEQYCIDTVMTFWHYHGGCQVGKVVDRDYKVFGVDRLRVIDGSTFNFSPGTNPQATLMMLGR